MKNKYSFFFKTFIFLWAILGVQQNWEGSKEILRIFPAPTDV